MGAIFKWALSFREVDFYHSSISPPHITPDGACRPNILHLNDDLFSFILNPPMIEPRNI